MVISNRKVRLLAAGALALSAPALAACSTEMPTDKVYNQAVGTNERHASTIDVLNAMIVSSEPGSGTLITTLVNNDNKTAGGEDSEVTLTEVELTGTITVYIEEDNAETGEAEIVAKEIDIAPEAEVPGGLRIPAEETLALSKLGEGGIKVTTAECPDDQDEEAPCFRTGDYVEVTLTFDGAEPVTLEVPVVANAGYHVGQDGPPAPTEPTDEPTTAETEEAEAH